MKIGTFDFEAHLARQAAFSALTFGPATRTEGICDHIRKELEEVAAAPGDLKEWIDVAILALDGAWRCGATPAQIIEALVAKQSKNEGRAWPDWRTADPSKAIEHDRSGEQVVVAAAPVQAQEPTPEAAQQNGGLVRAALIDLMALERQATSACDGFKAQRDCNLRFARARKALADSADAAPVQPVAVPDGAIKLTPDQMRLVLEALTHSRPTQDQYQEPLLRHAEAMKVCCAAVSAAPAAQGDAKDAELIAELRSVYAIYNGHGEDLRDLAERAANRIATIAAKAAS